MSLLLAVELIVLAFIIGVWLLQPPMPAPPPREMPIRPFGHIEPLRYPLDRIDWPIGFAVYQNRTMMKLIGVNYRDA